MQNSKGNVGGLDFIVGHLNILREGKPLRLMRCTRNWPVVPFFFLGAVRPFRAKFTDGTERTYENVRDFHSDAMAKYLAVENMVEAGKHGELDFVYGGERLRLAGSPNLYGEVMLEDFVDDQYDWLQVKDRIVVDIGAYVGDSAMYFVTRGAKKVYAFEPYPAIYNVAKKNIEINGFRSKVEVINEGCGGESHSLTIDPEFKHTGGAAAKGFQKGKRIKIRTLAEIVNKYRISNALLKMDCEGDEYDIILESRSETLRRFERIMIEFHYGYKDLERKLYDAGFRVKHSSLFFVGRSAKRAGGFRGMLYAHQ